MRLFTDSELQKKNLHVSYSFHRHFTTSSLPNLPFKVNDEVVEGGVVVHLGSFLLGAVFLKQGSGWQLCEDNIPPVPAEIMQGD